MVLLGDEHAAGFRACSEHVEPLDGNCRSGQPHRPGIIVVVESEEFLGGGMLKYLTAVPNVSEGLRRSVHIGVSLALRGNDNQALGMRNPRGVQQHLVH